jgi:hypothetical protein
MTAPREPRRASGSFDVKITAQTQDADEAAILGRKSLAKVFHGDLEGEGRGVMLALGTAVAGSAAYSAIERIEGRLHGRTGSFALQHTGVMDRGSPDLAIRVVPDSGTGELEGLAGTLAIRIADGAHFYEFDYTLAEGSS